jgi:hypothetical protein
MTTYTISKSQESYVFGVIHTLLHLEQCNIETLWDFFDDYCSDPKGEFICAVKELNSLEIIDKWYKFVDDEYIELSKEEEDEADDVEIRD